MSNLRFSSYYRTVVVIGRRSGLHLPWEDNEPMKSRITTSVLQSIIGVFLLWRNICALYAMTHSERSEDVIYGCALLMFMSTGTMLSLFYFGFGDKFKVLTDRMDDVTRLLVDAGLGRREYFVNLYKSNARYICIFTKLLTTTTITGPMFTVASVALFAYYEGTYGEKMGLPTHCPFELNNPSLYEFSYIVEYFSLAFPAMQKLGNEFLMLGMFRLQATYFKYLSATMEELGQQPNKEDIQQKIVTWIKLHQAVIRNGHDLLVFFSPVVIMYYLGIIGIVAGGLFYQLNSTAQNSIYMLCLGMYLLVTVMHLYVQCHMADQLSTEAENLALTVYNTPWYTLDVRSKSYIKLIINMANRPIRIVAYRAPSFTLNKETFVAYMTNTISAYMGFSKIMEISE